MANETEVLAIPIVWSAGTPKQCTVIGFVADQGSRVVVSSTGTTGPVFLVFPEGTPFAKRVCEINEPLVVREDASPGTYTYLVVWPRGDGMGNGTGVVRGAGPG